MPINKAGGTNINETDAPANASALVDFLEAELVNAGWSIVSGGGTDAITFRSAATANGSYQCRVITSVSGSVVRLKLAEGDGSNEQTNFFGACNVDGTSTWRLLANRHAFVLWEQGSARSVGRKWCMAGCLYVNSDLAASSSIEAFGFSDMHSNGDASARPSFRSIAALIATGVASVSSGMGAYYVISDGTSAEGSSNGAGTARHFPRIFAPCRQPTDASDIPDLWWGNGDFLILDCLLGWSLGGAVNQPSAAGLRWRGWFFDCLIVIGKDYAELTEITFDGDTYIVFGSGIPQSGQQAFSIAWLKPSA